VDVIFSNQSSRGSEHSLTICCLSPRITKDFQI